MFEPSPRMHNLFQRSFAEYDDITVRGSHATDGRDWIADLGRPDYKIALGSLPKFCRLSEEAFPGTPYLIPSPISSNKYAKDLAKLGRRPKIGVTWQGGVPTTEVHLRSLFPKELASILEQEADFISLQYTADATSDVADLKRMAQGIGTNRFSFPKRRFSKVGIHSVSARN